MQKHGESGVNQYAQRIISTPGKQDGLASQIAVVKAMGMPLDYLEKYITRIRSVEPDQIQSVAKKIIAPDQSAIVVVGDANKIGPAVEKFK